MVAKLELLSDIFDFFLKLKESKDRYWKKNERDRKEKIIEAGDDLEDHLSGDDLKEGDCKGAIKCITKLHTLIRKYFAKVSSPDLPEVKEFWELYEQSKRYLYRVRHGKIPCDFEQLQSCHLDLAQSLDNLLDLELKVWMKYCDINSERTGVIADYNQSLWVLA